MLNPNETIHGDYSEILNKTNIRVAQELSIVESA